MFGDVRCRNNWGKIILCNCWLVSTFWKETYFWAVNVTYLLVYFLGFVVWDIMYWISFPFASGMAPNRTWCNSFWGMFFWIRDDIISIRSFSLRQPREWGAVRDAIDGGEREGVDSESGKEERSVMRLVDWRGRAWGREWERECCNWEFTVTFYACLKTHRFVLTVVLNVVRISEL